MNRERWKLFWRGHPWWELLGADIDEMMIIMKKLNPNARSTL